MSCGSSWSLLLDHLGYTSRKAEAHGEIQREGKWQRYRILSILPYYFIFEHIAGSSKRNREGTIWRHFCFVDAYKSIWAYQGSVVSSGANNTYTLLYIVTVYNYSSSEDHSIVSWVAHQETIYQIVYCPELAVFKPHNKYAHTLQWHSSHWKRDICMRTTMSLLAPVPKGKCSILASLL